MRSHQSYIYSSQYAPLEAIHTTLILRKASLYALEKHQFIYFRKVNESACCIAIMVSRRLQFSYKV